jgi:hypothetical protein
LQPDQNDNYQEEQEPNRKHSNSKNRKRNPRKRHFPICPICQSSVRDLYTAIAFGEENIPAHFDCIMKELAASEELQEKERISYLGGGSFGIVQNTGGGKFFIRKRIQFEQKELNLDWRKYARNRAQKRGHRDR